MKKVEKESRAKVAKEKLKDADALIDPSAYGYKPDAMLEIPARLFMEATKFFQKVADQNKESVFILSESFDETIKNHKVHIKPLGMESIQYLEAFTAIHVDNVKKGKAIYLPNYNATLDKEMDSPVTEEPITQ